MIYSLGLALIARINTALISFSHRRKLTAMDKTPGPLGRLVDNLPDSFARTVSFVDSMRKPAPDPDNPTSEGWYSDPATGGTQYWDGQEWTGDKRPERRSFAAPYHESVLGYCAIVILGGFSVLIISGVFGGEGFSPFALLIVPVLLVVGLAILVYCLRGQGPSTQDVQTRVEERRKEAKTKRRKANAWGVVAGVSDAITGSVTQRPSSAAQGNAAQGNVAQAAQITALSDPETAKSLKQLQDLLYTRTITDAEFQTAKDRLLAVTTGPSVSEQLHELDELHRRGVLGDFEYAQAKSRLLKR